MAGCPVISITWVRSLVGWREDAEAVEVGRVALKVGRELERSTCQDKWDDVATRRDWIGV